MDDPAKAFFPSDLAPRASSEEWDRAPVVDDNEEGISAPGIIHQTLNVRSVSAFAFLDQPFQGDRRCWPATLMGKPST